MLLPPKPDDRRPALSWKDPAMLLTTYRTLLRTPNFKGRHRLDSWMRRRLAPQSVVVEGGVRMVLDPLEWTQIELLSRRPQEPLTAALVNRLLQPGKTVVDVGAHVGWLSLIAARAVGPSGAVVAVDPQPYNCDRILTNAQANEFANITVVAAAIGEKNSIVRLPNQSTSDKARLTLAGSGINDTDLTYVTQLLTLPRLFEILELTRVALLKIDVEGFELPVFRGAQSVLHRIDNIIFECLPENATDTKTIRGLLSAAGFSFHGVDGRPYAGGRVPENNIWACQFP